MQVIPPEDYCARAFPGREAHFKPFVGHRGGHFQSAALLFLRVRDAGRALHGLSDFFRREGVVIDLEIVDASFEQRVGGKLAASDVVQQRFEVRRAQCDVLRGGHELSVHVEAGVFRVYGDGHVHPCVFCGLPSVQPLFFTAVFEREAYVSVVRPYSEEHVFVLPVAEVEDALPGAAPLPIYPCRHGDFLVVA